MTWQGYPLLDQYLIGRNILSILTTEQLSFYAVNILREEMVDIFDNMPSQEQRNARSYSSLNRLEW